MIKSVYAAYRGERYIGYGTLKELAKLLGVKRRTLLWYRYPAAKKRVEKTEKNRKKRGESMKSKCELVRKGEVRRKGKVVDKIINENKVVYTCSGYVDAMTYEPLDECKRCELWYCKYW